MTEINPENAILAELIFGIGGIKAQMETVEAMANRTALTVKETFAKTQLGTGLDASQMTAQQAMVSRITAEGEASRKVITAKGEAEISAITAKEALTRQKILKESAAAELATIQKQMAQEKLLYTRTREQAFAARGSMSDLMQRRFSWLGSGALLMGGMYGIGETVQTIKDVEMGMTTIARVTEDVAFNFKGMRDELQQLGVTYGDTWADVSDIAIKWAQAGYNQAETLELTKDSLLALNTAELNSEQATSGMIAIMAQWGLTADELLPVIDKINKVADDFAITSTDLVAGLQRSSGAAKVLGLSLNETIAILTTMREATGRTGKEVGNALNSILSFMQRPVAIKAFETEGIQVFADEARTQFRNVIEVFGEMAQKWPQMSEASRNAMADQAEAAGLYTEEMAEVVGMEEQYNDIQQRNLSQAAAGIYRRNYLLALLQNWSKVDEVLVSQENALGYSMKENERTMQTLEKQVEVLKASAEQLAVALGDAGLLNELTALVEGVTDAVQWFNNLDDDMQMFLLTVIEVTAAVKLLDAALKMAGVSALLNGGTKVAGLVAMGVSFKEAATGLAGISAMATGARAAIGTLGRGLLAAFGGPVGVALVTAGTAIGFIARETNKINEELQEHAVMAENLIGEYDSLTNRLNGTTRGTGEYNQAAKELSELKNNIADSLPELIDGWDSETESLKINRQGMQNMIDAGKDLKKAKEDLAASDAEIARIQEERKTSENKIQEWESELNVLNDLTERRDKLTDTLAKQKTGSEEAEKAQEALGETERLIADIAQEAGLKRNATVDAIITKIKDERIAESERVKQKYKDEQELVTAAKQGALDRLKILDEEIAAQKSLLPGGKWYEYIPGPLKGISSFIAKTKLGNRQEEAAEKQEIIDTKNAELNKLDNAIKEAERNIANINANSALGDKPPSDGSTSGGSTSSKADAIAKSLDQLGFASKSAEMANAALESSLARLNDRLGIANSEYTYLASKVETGTATTQDFARMQELVAVKTALVNDEQIKLVEANQQYQQQIGSLTPVLAKATAEYDRFKAAGDSDHMKDAESAVSDLQGEINRLSGAIASNTQKLWENKSTLEELTRTTYTEYYQSAMTWANHMEAIGRMNTEQQLKYLETIDATMLSQADAWKLEEERFSERKQLLQDEMDAIKDAYDKKMQEYQDEIDANDTLIEKKESAIESYRAEVDEQITAIQKLIDALDTEDEEADRESALKDHNERIAELDEQLAYERVRTGVDHLENIKDINQQIEEENRAWAEKQADWARADQKEAYQDQIDALNDQADAYEDEANEEIKLLQKSNDKKKSEMESYYNEIEDLLNDNTLNMLAALGSANESMYEKGLDWMRNLAQGIEDGQTSLPSGFSDFVSDVEDNYNNLPSGSSTGQPTAPTQSTTTNNNEAIKAQAHAKAESARQQLISLGYSQGASDISSYDTVEGTQNWYNRYIADRTDLSQNVKDLFWDIVEARQQWTSANQAHTGAFVQTSGIAELLKGERVLSPDLTISFDRLASAIIGNPNGIQSITQGGISDKGVDRIVAAIENKMKINVDKAVNIEHVSFSDRADEQSLGFEVRSVLSSM